MSDFKDELFNTHTAAELNPQRNRQSPPKNYHHCLQKIASKVN